jgi:subfamily B ATP-binding cassette protein HlyB/CyaB
MGVELAFGLRSDSAVPDDVRLRLECSAYPPRQHDRGGHRRAGCIAASLPRLAQLWQDFQQFRLSIERLADIIDTPTEPNAISAKQNLPTIQGHLRFENIVFRYRAGSPEILRDLSLEIRAGEVIGIVGRSGSGKSTLTKLLQRLYMPERGRVMVDSLDVALLDPAWLRRQIGVVLQENVLFNRSIRENIALVDPSMPLERVIHAAQLAGAHEFVLELPHGYDTILEERGANLSGGQRQRVAIARALVTNPRILIFDEATSALDYESERVIQSNMRAICQGRTVLIVAHRLSTVRTADRILVMERGQLAEAGREPLLAGARASCIQAFFKQLPVALKGALLTFDRAHNGAPAPFSGGDL